MHCKKVHQNCPKQRLKLEAGIIEIPAEEPSIKERDTEAKRTIKRYADRKSYMKPNYLRVGDTVIVKRDHNSKALTPYQPNPMTK